MRCISRRVEPRRIWAPPAGPARNWSAANFRQVLDGRGQVGGRRESAAVGEREDLTRRSWHARTVAGRETWQRRVGLGARLGQRERIEDVALDVARVRLARDRRDDLALASRNWRIAVEVKSFEIEAMR